MLRKIVMEFIRHCFGVLYIAAQRQRLYQVMAVGGYIVGHEDMNYLDRFPAFFQSLIIPAAFREVLLYILWEQEEDDEASEDSWQKKWMDFAEEIATYDKPHEEDQLYDWIDDVVSEFSNQHKFSEHLVKRMESYSDE